MPCDVNVAFLLISSEIKKYCDAHNYQYEYIDSEKMSNAFVNPFVKMDPLLRLVAFNDHFGWSILF